MLECSAVVGLVRIGRAGLVEPTIYGVAALDYQAGETFPPRARFVRCPFARQRGDPKWPASLVASHDPSHMSFQAN